MVFICLERASEDVRSAPAGTTASFTWFHDAARRPVPCPTICCSARDFSRNWGGPLSEEITGSLLAELYDDATLVSALRQGPFEDAFRGFSPTGAVNSSQRRFEDAISGVFSRLNKTFVDQNIRFSNYVAFSIKDFLAQFDAIFTLNQDLLLEIHYMQTFIQQRRFSSVILPGIRLASLKAAGAGRYGAAVTT